MGKGQLTKAIGVGMGLVILSAAAPAIWRRTAV